MEVLSELPDPTLKVLALFLAPNTHRGRRLNSSDLTSSQSFLAVVAALEENVQCLLVVAQVLATRRNVVCTVGTGERRKLLEIIFDFIVFQLGGIPKRWESVKAGGVDGGQLTKSVCHHFHKQERHLLKVKLELRRREISTKSFTVFAQAFRNGCLIVTTDHDCLLCLVLVRTVIEIICFFIRQRLVELHAVFRVAVVKLL